MEFLLNLKKYPGVMKVVVSGDIPDEGIKLLREKSNRI